jgi:hypothetical protein
MSGLQASHDLPGGGKRMIRRPEGVASVWVNGVRVFDGKSIVAGSEGPGQLLTEFDS